MQGLLEKPQNIPCACKVEEDTCKAAEREHIGCFSSGDGPGEEARIQGFFCPLVVAYGIFEEESGYFPTVLGGKAPGSEASPKVHGADEVVEFFFHDEDEVFHSLGNGAQVPENGKAGEKGEDISRGSCEKEEGEGKGREDGSEKEGKDEGNGVVEKEQKT